MPRRAPSIVSWSALALTVVGACATPAPAGSTGAAAPPPDLTPEGLRLFHEVALDLPEHGQQSLLGALTFRPPGGYTLRAETPFGVRLFEVGHDGQRLWAELAPPLEGKFPALGLAKSVWRIYFGGCRGAARCRLPSGAELEERRAGTPPRLVHRTLRDPGGTVTEIDYEDWRPTGPALHPHRIRLRTGRFAVQILVSGFDRL